MDFITLFDSFIFVHIKHHIFCQNLDRYSQDVWFSAPEPFTTKNSSFSPHTRARPFFRILSTWV